MHSINKHKTTIIERFACGNANVIKVALVMGGMSDEREVSLTSGKCVLNEMKKSKKYDVTAIDMGNDVAKVLEEINPDVVFNCLHGTYGEDGCLQGLLEIMGIAYTHSGILASSVGMNKYFTNQLLNKNGVRTPKHRLVCKNESLETDPMERPYVIKPIDEGSSVGVEIIFKDTNFKFADYKWEFGDKILVEEYIPGKELSAAVINDKAIGILELRPKEGFYDYKAKYTKNVTEHIMPADISEEAYEYILEVTQKVHDIVGAKVISRIDLRYNPEIKNLEEAVNVLEINTHPGFTDLSILPEIGQYYGISYISIIDLLIEKALIGKENKLGKCA